MAHHFKLTGIFGPIIMTFLDPQEQAIILDYCGSKMNIYELYAATTYCVRNDLLDYLNYFIERTMPDIILIAGAAAHNQLYVDLAINRGAKNYSAAMVEAVKTDDIKWVKYFKNLGGNNYEDAMIEAMKRGNIELMRDIWRWDQHTSINVEGLVQNLGWAPNPLEVLKLFDALGITVSDVAEEYGCTVQYWNHELQIRMISALSARNYDVRTLAHGIVISGNLDALCIISDPTLDYETLLQTAELYGHKHIVDFINSLYRDPK